jgi:hypothetical protein
MTPRNGLLIVLYGIAILAICIAGIMQAGRIEKLEGRVTELEMQRVNREEKMHAD